MFESEIKELKEKLFLLESAEKFSKLRSDLPLEALLDETIEHLLLLKEGLAEGRLPQATNPELRFLDIVDEINNPKQIKVRDRRPEIIDESLSNLCLQLALTLVSFKKSLKSHFLDDTLVSQIHEYRSKLERRVGYSANLTNSIQLFVQEWLHNKKDVRAVLEFLQWHFHLK